MHYCDRSRVVVSAHNGVVVKCYCLPLRQRSLFLEHWEDAWEIIKESVLAQSAAQHDKAHAIAYLWDEGNRDGADDRCKYFVWLCKEMLRIHGVNALELDIHQLTELLFFSEGGNGLLFNLQFPPIPPGSRGKAEAGDPQYKLMAMLSFRSGNWIEAQKVVAEIPYDEVVKILAEQEKLYEQSKRELDKGTGTAPPPPLPEQTPEQLAEQQRIRQEALRKFQEGQMLGKEEQRQRALETIAKMAQERQAAGD